MSAKHSPSPADKTLVQDVRHIFEENRASAAAAIDLAAASGEPYTISYMTTWGSVAATLRRDWREARRLGEEAVRFSDDQGYRFNATVGRFTGGIRIHHGYVGLLLMGLGALLRQKKLACARWLWVIGTALLLSDLIHHFALLWPLMNDPMFHLVYPDV